jgi:four helix bundle protein
MNVEAQSAESRADFIHKMRLVLKKLRETRIWLLIIVRAGLIKPVSKLDVLINENNQLISIFVEHRTSNSPQASKHLSASGGSNFE